MNQNFIYNEAPRIGENAERPGNYSFSTSLSNHIVDPGREIKLKVFITGYGNIDNCKIHLNYPDDIFEEEMSKLYTGLIYTFKDVDEKTGIGTLTISHGKEEVLIKNSGCLLAIDNGGFVGQNWPHEKITPFFDTGIGKTPVIATEHYSDKAPIECCFSISAKAKAGIYNIYLVMNYFNGHEWKGDRIEIPITVTSIFQRNEVLFTKLAIWLAAVSTVFSILDVFIDHYTFLLDILFNLVLPLALFNLIKNLVQRKPLLLFPSFKIK